MLTKTLVVPDQTETPEVREAQSLKKEGNDAFAQRDWDNAASLWQEALLRLPALPEFAPRSSQSKPVKAAQNKTDAEDEESHAEEAVNEDASAPPLPAEEEASDAVKKLRAALSANLAAVYIKLEKWEEASKACTKGTSGVLFELLHGTLDINDISLCYQPSKINPNTSKLCRDGLWQAKSKGPGPV